MSKWIKHKILKKTYIRIKPCWMNIMKRKRVFNLSSIGLVLLLPYVLVGMVNGSERILMNAQTGYGNVPGSNPFLSDFIRI